MSSSLKDRAIGCLLGQAIGDALGTTYEFSRAKGAKIMMKEQYQRANGFLPIVGQGPFSLSPGQITDDTELALGLARTLAKRATSRVGHQSDKLYDREAVAQAYLGWYRSGPFDIGRTTRTAFARANSYLEVVENSRQASFTSLSNGCLMRISPLAIAGVGRVNSANYQSSLHQLLKDAATDCRMTNPNPITIDAVRVFVSTIRDIILSGGDRELIYFQALERAQTPEVKRILQEAEKTPYPTLHEQPLENDDPHMGYFGIALQNTFYEFLHTRDFYQAMINIISRGGDTDTNACIAGALLGATVGHQQLPKEWVETVLTSNQGSAGSYKRKREREYPAARTDDLIELAKKLI